LKILQLSPSYKPAYIYGGPIYSVAKLCEVLSSHEEHVITEVLTTTANGKSELDVEVSVPLWVDGVRVTYFNRLTKDHSHFSPSLLKHLRKALTQRKQENTILHIHAWWNLVSVLSCWIAKRYGIPVVLSPRGMITAYSQLNRNGWVKNIFQTLVGKRLLEYCHIHATSEQEKSDVLKIVKPRSIYIISNLISLPEVKADVFLSAKSSVFELIFLSRIEHKKGLELLIAAVARLEIPWRLTIAGNGEPLYVESLKKIAEDLSIGSKIAWIGQVSNDDKFELLNQHDLLILPSYNENFANVVLESLSVGTPVLISDQVGLSDYVQQKNLGYICKLDPSAIKAQIELAYQDISKRQEIRKKAPGLIRQDFNDQVLINQYLMMYQKVLKG